MDTISSPATPGLAAVRAAYRELRDAGVQHPTVAQDWLVEHVRRVVREDLEARVGLPGEKQDAALTDGAQDADLARAVAGTLAQALAVYNRRRKRLTEFDCGVTAKGARAVNRAAVIRQAKATADDRYAAFLRTVQIDEVAVNPKTKRRYYVAATIVVGGQVRAVSAVFLRAGRGNEVKLEDFTVLP